jgi:hypothetical protein
MACGTLTTAKVNPATASAARFRRWGWEDWVAVPEDFIWRYSFTNWSTVTTAYIL